MKVSREFLETIINYSHASSKDETRPFLNTVAIRCIDSNTLELTATDGYVAIRSQHNVTKEHNITKEVDDKSNYYLVYKDNIPKIKLYLKEWKAHNIFELEIGDNFIKISTNKESLHYIKLHLIDREYPRMIDDIFDNKNTCKLEGISFNPDKVTQLRKSVYGTKAMKGYARFDFTFTKDAGPMLCKCKHNGIDHNLIFMPLLKV